MGVAWGSYNDYVGGGIKTRAWYVDPLEPIYKFITELTGITDGDIVNYSSTHQTIADELSAIMGSEECFVNPITWGGGDSIALLDEFTERGIQFKHFGRRWIDVKTFYIYNRLSQGLSTKGGLGSAMPKYGIHFEGSPHRADADAYNTLRLFFAMLGRQSGLEGLLGAARSIK